MLPGTNVGLTYKSKMLMVNKWEMEKKFCLPKNVNRNPELEKHFSYYVKFTTVEGSIL